MKTGQRHTVDSLEPLLTAQHVAVGDSQQTDAAVSHELTRIYVRIWPILLKRSDLPAGLTSAQPLDAHSITTLRGRTASSRDAVQLADLCCVN